MRQGAKAARVKERQLEVRYRQLLTQHLVRLLADGGLNFCSLVRRAGGAYPTEILSVLQELTQLRTIAACGTYYTLVQGSVQIGNCSDAKQAPQQISIEHQDSRDLETPPCLGEPHPADYDWRYSSSSLTALREKAVPVIQARGRVALLGCPSLFPVLASIGGKVTLFDRRPAAIDQLRSLGLREGLIKHDLFDPLDGIKSEYDLVIADPPWYPTFHKAFIVRASELLRGGGLLLLSVLPWLTRPEAIKDRAEIFEFGGRAGFDLSGFEEGVLRYQTPPFERAALATQGIECGEWRHGDLGTFRKIGDAPELATPRPSNEPEWDEFRLGCKTVKVRRRKEASRCSFRAEFVDVNAVLGSVSRRSPLRAKIDLWTSDNVAYKVSGLTVVREALARLQRGEAPQEVADEVAESFGLAPRESQAVRELLSNLLQNRFDNGATRAE